MTKKSHHHTKLLILDVKMNNKPSMPILFILRDYETDLYFLQNSPALRTGIRWLCWSTPPNHTAMGHLIYASNIWFSRPQSGLFTKLEQTASINWVSMGQMWFFKKSKKIHSMCWIGKLHFLQLNWNPSS